MTIDPYRRPVCSAPHVVPSLVRCCVEKARQFSDWPSSDVVDISASEPDVAEAIRGAKACAG